MTEENYIYLLNLLKDMINKYKGSTNLLERECYLRFINNFVSTFQATFVVLKPNDIYFLNKVDDLIYESKIADDLSELIVKLNKNNKNRSRYEYCSLQYLESLIKNIKVYDNSYNKFNIQTDDAYIKDYLKEDKCLLLKYEYDKRTVFYDEKFNGGKSIPLYLFHDNLNIILIDSFDITVLFHEFLHGIYLNTETLYRETPNILGELALQKQYGLNSTIDRLEGLRIAKKFSSTIFSNRYYLIGTILSHAIINKYGSDIKTINYFMNLISKNDQIDLKSMLQLCNISEQDIFTSFNKSKSYVYER